MSFKNFKKYLIDDINSLREEKRTKLKTFLPGVLHALSLKWKNGKQRNAI